MPKTIGFKTTEIISVGLVNLTQCPECEVYVNYNGLPPRFCPQGHEIPTKPVAPAGEDSCHEDEPTEGTRPG